MTPRYTLKEISNIAKEIAKDLNNHLDDIHITDKEHFEIAIETLIDTLIDLENI